MSFQRRLFTAPWPVFLATYTAFSTALMALLRWMYEFPRPSLWLGPAIGVLSTVILVTRRIRLRAQGRYESMLAAGDAFLAARVPADPAARAELIRMMPMQRMSVSGLGRWFWVYLAVLALIQIPAALDRPRVWLMVTIMAAMTGLYAWWTPRNRRRVDAIDRQLGIGAWRSAGGRPA